MEASTQTGGTGQAQDKAQQVAGQAQEKVQEAAGQAKGRARDQVDQRSTQAGEQVSTSAHDMRSVAEHLRSEGKDQPAKLAEQAADRAERLGGYLKDSDADRILHDLEDFGRKQPLAVMAGGLALGFAASRFLKASSQARASSTSTTGPSYGQARRPLPAGPEGADRPVGAPPPFREPVPPAPTPPVAPGPGPGTVPGTGTGTGTGATSPGSLR